MIAYVKRIDKPPLAAARNMTKKKNVLAMVEGVVFLWKLDGHSNTLNSIFEFLFCLLSFGFFWRFCDSPKSFVIKAWPTPFYGLELFNLTNEIYF